MANDTVTDGPQPPAGTGSAGPGPGTGPDAAAIPAAPAAPGAPGTAPRAPAAPSVGATPGSARDAAADPAGVLEDPASRSAGTARSTSRGAAEGRAGTLEDPASPVAPGTPSPPGASGTSDATDNPFDDIDASEALVRRPRNPVVRAARAVANSFAGDMVVFFSVPVREIRTRKLRAIPATLVCVALIGVLWVLEMIRPTGLAFVQQIAGVRQGEPLWQLLPQLPLSLFAPAPDLPAWGAMTQVLVAFGISECWLGWKKTIGVAMITSAVTSMAARLMVYASNWLHIGTPQIDNFQVDTGPSVAVVALLIYLALRLRTYWVVALTAVTMGGEAAILPNLAGREHLVAISLGIVTYFLLDRWWPAWQRRKIERATSD